MPSKRPDARTPKDHIRTREKERHHERVNIQEERQVVRQERKNEAEDDERNDRELKVRPHPFVPCEAVTACGEQEPEEVLGNEIEAKKLDEGRLTSRKAKTDQPKTQDAPGVRPIAESHYFQGATQKQRQEGNESYP